VRAACSARVEADALVELGEYPEEAVRLRGEEGVVRAIVEPPRHEATKGEMSAGPDWCLGGFFLPPAPLTAHAAGDGRGGCARADRHADAVAEVVVGVGGASV